MRKRILSGLLCVCMAAGMLLAVVPTAFAITATPDASGPETIAQLQARFPNGKYWNHVGADNYNNPHGYNPLNLPCDHHNIACGFYPNQCECNSFDNAIQCMGFAFRLAFGYYRTSVRTWSQEDNSGLASLKAGDVVDFNWSGYGVNRTYGHTIWITGVQGDTITYADCNYGYTCKIRWNVSGNKYSVITGNYTIHHAPYAITETGSTPSQPAYCAAVRDLGADFYAYIYNPQSGCNIENHSNNVQLASVNKTDPRQIWHFIRQDETSYAIINMYDGRCLDTDGPEWSSGVHVLEYNGNELQKWRLYNPTSSSGPFYISPYRYNIDNGSHKAHEYVLDVEGGKSAPGTNVQLYSNWYRQYGNFSEPYMQAQLFQINKIDDIGSVLAYDVGDEFYAQISYNGSYLQTTGDPIGDGSGYGMDVRTTRVSNKSDPNQIWYFDRWPDGSYKIVNMGSGWCLDVQSGIAENKKNVWTWHDDHGGLPERWYIFNSPGEDVYRLVSGVNYPWKGEHSLYAIDIPGGDTAQGANAEIYQQNKNPWQYFEITPVRYKPEPVPTVIAAPPTASAINYGQELVDSKLTGGAVVDSSGKTVPGSWLWTDPSARPAASGKFQAMFTPATAEDVSKYGLSSAEVSVTVNKSTPVLSVSAYQSGTLVTVHASASNPYHEALTDVPAPTVTYRIGNRAAQALTGGSFTIPAGTENGTVITITAATAESGGYRAAEKRTTLTVAGLAGATSYHVLTTSGSNLGGSVSIQPTTAKRGETVTVAATPRSGYTLRAVTATDASGALVWLRSLGNGRYTFTMPDSNVTLGAIFEVAPDDWVNPFSDVSEGAWYYDAVKFVSQNGLMSGSGGVFDHSGNLSRAMIAQILYNREGRPAVSGSQAFHDVSRGIWYSDAVSWAAANKLLLGDENGSFSPEAPITREQLAVVLWRYAGKPASYGGALNFTDAGRVSGYAQEAVRWAVRSGIIKGKDGGVLDPLGPATRAQVAQMLKNYLEG